MKMFLRVGLIIALLVVAVPLLLTLFESNNAYRNTLAVENTEVSEQLFQDFADQLVQKSPEIEPVVVIVPLNGSPDSIYHPSFKNAYAALQVLSRVSDREKVLVLSEGYAEGMCTSGAELTLALLGMQEGYNNYNGVTILLEKEASTTYENIIFSKKLLSERYPQKIISVFIAGMSDKKLETNGFGIDIGHGARAYMLASQNLKSDLIQLRGLIPTDILDPSVQNYSSNYSFLTMVLGAIHLLQLPSLDKKTNGSIDSSCVM